MLAGGQSMAQENAVTRLRSVPAYGPCREQRPGCPRWPHVLVTAIACARAPATAIASMAITAPGRAMPAQIVERAGYGVAKNVW